MDLKQIQLETAVFNRFNATPFETRARLVAGGSAQYDTYFCHSKSFYAHKALDFYSSQNGFRFFHGVNVSSHSHTSEAHAKKKEGK